MPRKKLGRSSLHARVAPETPDKIKQIAFNLGFVYDNEGSTRQLLDAIANSEVVSMPAKNLTIVSATYSETLAS